MGSVLALNVDTLLVGTQTNVVGFPSHHDFLTRGMIQLGRLFCRDYPRYYRKQVELLKVDVRGAFI